MGEKEDAQIYFGLSAIMSQMFQDEGDVFSFGIDINLNSYLRPVKTPNDLMIEQKALNTSDFFGLMGIEVPGANLLEIFNQLSKDSLDDLVWTNQEYRWPEEIQAEVLPKLSFARPV